MEKVEIKLREYTLKIDHEELESLYYLCGSSKKLEAVDEITEFIMNLWQESQGVSKVTMDEHETMKVLNLLHQFKKDYTTLQSICIEEQVI